MHINAFFPPDTKKPIKAFASQVEETLKLLHIAPRTFHGEAQGARCDMKELKGFFHLGGESLDGFLSIGGEEGVDMHES